MIYSGGLVTQYPCYMTSYVPGIFKLIELLNSLGGIKICNMFITLWLPISHIITVYCPVAVCVSIFHFF